MIFSVYSIEIHIKFIALVRKNRLFIKINIAVSFQNEPESAREAFDAFLARYPYCYGYWKKYADLETKNDNMDEAEKVRFFTPEEFDLDLVECVSYHVTMLHWGTLSVPIKYLTMSFVLFTTGSREKKLAQSTAHGSQLILLSYFTAF